MDKPIHIPQRTESKISKMAAQATTYHPFIPGRDSRHHRPRAHNLNKGFSGTLVPNEARGKSNSIETQEPTSPRVSCIGQVKHNNKNKNKKKNKNIKEKLSEQKHASPLLGPVPFSRPERDGPTGPNTEIKRVSGFGRKSYVEDDRRDKRVVVDDKAPSLGQMRKFASSRDELAGFDWTSMRNDMDDQDLSIM